MRQGVCWRLLLPLWLGLLGLPGLVAGAEAAWFQSGLEVFLNHYTALARGKRVALFTNQTGVDAQGRSNIDLLFRHPDVALVKLLSPEHGIRGQVTAGKVVANAVDTRTGLPVISLYGGEAGFRPKREHLQGVDLVIYDVQDVGSRAYTYIWSLAEVMTACGELGVELMILDRPCVFGAVRIDGPLCEPKFKSLLTRFPLPRLYGMTAGELGRYFNEECALNCRLTVIPMAGYRRGMTYESTGLPWVPPSPNIPDLNAARCFAATGTIGMSGQVHIGMHTRLPFQLIGAPWLRAAETAAELNAVGLGGISFAPTSFRPERGFFQGQTVQAVTLVVTDPSAFEPATVEAALLLYLARRYPHHFQFEPGRVDAFDRAMGTSTVRLAIQQGAGLEELRQAWRRAQDEFLRARQRFLIYP